VSLNLTKLAVITTTHNHMLSIEVRNLTVHKVNCQQFRWVDEYAVMGYTIPYFYPLYPTGLIFSHLHTHAYFFVPYPYPNMDFTHLVPGHCVLISIPSQQRFSKQGIFRKTSILSLFPTCKDINRKKSSLIVIKLFHN
jgi:hypothetical protein